MPLRDFLSSTWDHIQDNLFPWLREELGPLTDLHKRVIVTLELARVETLVGEWRGLPGRPPSDRAADGGQAIAPAVRLGAPWTSAGCIRLLAGFRQVCAQRAAEPRPRGADQTNPSRPAGRSHLARCDRHRGPREAGETCRAAATEAPARPAQEGRGGREQAAAARAPSHHVARRDVERSADALRGWNQAQCQGPQGKLDWLQAASRCRRWRYPD